MQRSVPNKKRSIVKLRVLSCLLTNGLTSLVLAKKLEAQGIHVNHKQLHQLLKAARQYKRSHPRWHLVEVWCADGEEFQVSL